MNLITEPVSSSSHVLRAIQTIFPDMSLANGPWIAGGACRRIVENDEIGTSDIDLFFRDAISFEMTERYLYEGMGTGRSWKVRNHSKFPKSYKIEVEFETKKYEFQLLGIRFYDSVEHLMSDFDFTACMLATDGKELIRHADALDDLKSRTLRFNVSPTVAKPARLAKYLDHGFTPVPGVLTTMLGVDLKSFDFTNEVLEQDDY